MASTRMPYGIKILKKYALAYWEAAIRAHMLH
jgi:hypothetical protein